MSKRIETDRSGLTGLVGGILLVFVGLLFLAGELFHVQLGRFLWPFFILAPGVVLFIAGLVTETKAGESLVVIGGIVTSIGMLLLFQNATHLWASWAYAWALVAPTSIGLSLIAHGSVHGKREKVEAGWRVTAVGGALFVAGFVFFELLLGISGFGLGRFGWPFLLIAGGVAVILFAILPRKRS